MNLPHVGAAGFALSLLAIVVAAFIIHRELRLRRLRLVKPPAPGLLEPVCSTCLNHDDAHPVWDNESQFCNRCHKVTTCYRVLVKGPTLEARP